MIIKRSSVFACVIFLLWMIFPLTGVYAQEEKPYKRQAGIDEKIKLYVSAWNTKDLNQRRLLVNQIWAVDGRYTDWVSDITGREELMRRISIHLRSWPGSRVVANSYVDSYKNVFRFSWSLVDAHGKEIMHGMDYGELSENGMLNRIVAFFGSFEPLK